MRFVPITALLIIMAARTACAQTQFEDLDPHRPVAVQDAYAIDRYAFELQLGPAASGPDARAIYAIEPVIAWGLGLDRMAMVALGIRDIRELFTNNVPNGLAAVRERVGR